MAAKDRWWTYPAQAESGRTVIVTGHDGLDKEMESGKYIYRVDVSWKYDALPDGMPADTDAQLMEQATDAFHEALRRDKAAVLTGIYTGDGERDWVFYTKNLRIFSTLFNRALRDLDQMPLEINAEEDPGWEEYHHTREETYIPEDDEE